MKKLMIAAAIVCAAAYAQAATAYAWQSNATIAYGETYDEIEGNNWVGGLYYLMQGDEDSAAAFANAIIAAGADGLVSTFNSQVASAANSATFDATTYMMDGAAKGAWSDDAWGIVWEMADTTSLPFYQVLLDTANNAFYVSEVANSDYTTVGASTIGLYNTSYDTFADATAYKGAGWYSVAADTPSDVPEPTSGLLMLVGLAGLALRRKQA